MRPTIEIITAAQTYPLRHRILSDGQPIEKVGRPGDDEALHFGFRKGQDLVGVISLYPQDQQKNHSERIWRIRGMAVDDDLQGRGIGSQLLEHAEIYLQSEFDIKEIWCNARKGARDFYAKHGYQVAEEVYITYPYVGYSYRMVKDFQ